MEVAGYCFHLNALCHPLMLHVQVRDKNKQFLCRLGKVFGLSSCLPLNVLAEATRFWVEISKIQAKISGIYHQGVSIAYFFLRFPFVPKQSDSVHDINV